MIRLKTFNGNNVNESDKIDTNEVNDDLIRGLGKEIESGVSKFWAKRGTKDPSKKTKGFGRQLLKK
jgi:hypothetical protein